VALTGDIGRALPAQLLALVIVLFGTSWPVMKIGIAEATPLWFAAARLSIAFLAACVLLVALRRFSRPDPADLPIVLSVGLLQLAAFIGLSTIALRHVPAGRSVVLAYTTVLWLVPLSLVTGERIGRWRMLGLGLGLAGLGVMVSPGAIDWSDRGVVLGHVLLLAAALVWALAIFHARRHRWRAEPIELLPWQILAGAAALLAVAALFEPDGHLPASRTVALTLGYLGVLAGPVATWSATMVSRHLPMVVSSIGFLGVPVVGLAASSIWLGEPIGLDLALGGLLILAGVVVVTIDSARPRAG
jgi:drug/metabolite transporter (DMT)-like permease